MQYMPAHLILRGHLKIIWFGHFVTAGGPPAVGRVSSGVCWGSRVFESRIIIPVIMIGGFLLFSALPNEKLRQCLEILKSNIVPHLFRLIGH